MKLYNQVYGKYTAGTGSWLDDELYEKGKKNIYNNEVLEYYKSIMGITQNFTECKIWFSLIFY